MVKGATPPVFLYVTHCPSSSRQVIELVAEMEVFRAAFVDTYSFLSDAGDVTDMVVALYADSDDNDDATAARRRSIRRRRGRLLQVQGEPSAQPSAEPTMTLGQEEDLSQLQNILHGKFSKIVRNLNNRNLQTVGSDSYSYEFSFSHSYTDEWPCYWDDGGCGSSYSYSYLYSYGDNCTDVGGGWQYVYNDSGACMQAFACGDNACDPSSCATDAINYTALTGGLFTCDDAGYYIEGEFAGAMPTCWYEEPCGSYSYSYSEPNYDDKNDTAAADDAGYAYFGNDDAATTTTTVELSYTFSFVVAGEVSRRRLRESLQLLLGGRSNDGDDDDGDHDDDDGGGARRNKGVVVGGRRRLTTTSAGAFLDEVWYMQ